MPGAALEEGRPSGNGITSQAKVPGSRPSPPNGLQVLKESVFEWLSRNEEPTRVQLTAAELLLQPTGGSGGALETFSLENLFGIQTYRHRKSASSPAAYLVFFFYPRVKRGVLSRSRLRERLELVFKVQLAGAGFEGNLELASAWKDSVLLLLSRKFSKWQLDRLAGNQSGLRPVGGKRRGFPFVPTEQKASSWPHGDLEDNEPAAQHDLSISVASGRLLLRRFVVILNPKSGQGKTMTIFKETVYPILTEAGIKTMLMVTERPGHARSMVSSADLSEVDGIVTVGGDGLLYEVVNGLRCRADARTYSNIPVGVIAGGSGNGLARSIASYSGEAEDYLRSPVLETTLAVAGGKVVPVNLLEVEVDSRKVYAFLSVGWGILADIDIESEVIRSIGESRFTLWSLFRIAKLKTYRALLSYGLLQREKTDGNENEDQAPAPPTVIEGDFVSVYATCQSHIGSDIVFAPQATANDGLIHLTYIPGNVGRARITQFLLGLDKGAHISVPGVKYVKVKEFSIRAEGGIAGTLTLDGEKVAGEHLSASISDRPLNVFSL